MERLKVFICSPLNLVRVQDINERDIKDNIYGFSFLCASETFPHEACIRYLICNILFNSHMYFSRLRPVSTIETHCFLSELGEQYVHGHLRTLEQMTT